MKIVLFIVLCIVGLVIASFMGLMIWTATVYNKVPSLDIPEDATQAEAVDIIDDYLTTLSTKKKFNGFVMISEGSQPLLVKAYGYSDHHLKTKLTTDSSLRLASVSKQFTAAGILVLQEKGEIDLDDLVTSYITDFPYEDVTIRHLLNQTSGMPDSYMELADTNKDEIDILTPAIFMDLLKRENLPAIAPPNEQYSYCNTSYVLLAYLIETVSGQSFEAFMVSEVFQPMGLENTCVWNLLSSDKTFPNKAESMDIFLNATPVKETFLDGVAGDGAVFSSANDFLMWDSFWYGNSLVSHESLQDAFQKPILNDGSVSDYGFGWLIREYGSFHNGQWLAANSFYLRNTRRKTAFVLVDNSSNVNFPKISLNIGLYFARQE